VLWGDTSLTLTPRRRPRPALAPAPGPGLAQFLRPPRGALRAAPVRGAHRASPLMSSSSTRSHPAPPGANKWQRTSRPWVSHLATCECFLRSCWGGGDGEWAPLGLSFSDCKGRRKDLCAQVQSAHLLHHTHSDTGVGPPLAGEGVQQRPRGGQTWFNPSWSSSNRSWSWKP
jgi:hypothetical protein